MTNEFVKTVDSGSRKEVYIILKDSLLEDPTAMQFDDMLSYACHQMGDLYEDHDGEELKVNPADWSQEYFYQQLTRMINNFSSERVALLKDMAAYFSEGGLKKLSPVKQSGLTAKYYLQMGVGTLAGIAAIILIMQGFTTLGLGLAITDLVITFVVNWKTRLKEEKQKKDNK